MSSALRLVEIEGKGRGYVATEPLKGGQVVLRESPILVFSAYPLTFTSYSKYCAHCYRRLGLDGANHSSALKCTSCDETIFCSSNCRSLAIHSTHSPWVCKSLNYLRDCPLLLIDQPEERQVQARYLVTAYNLAMISPSVFQTLLSLHGDGKRYMDIASFFHPIISSLSFPEQFPDLSLEMIAALLDKETTNSFNLMEPAPESGKKGIRAYALYSHVSFFNHSCLPNACRFQHIDSANDGNTDIIIRTTCDVQQGDEICLSYVRVTRNYADRRKSLLGYFQFACFCERCKIEANSGHEDRLESNYAEFAIKFVCGKENCGGTLAPLPPSDDGFSPAFKECNFCGTLQSFSR